MEDMDVTVAILESREITQLRVPPLRNDIGDNLAGKSINHRCTESDYSQWFITVDKTKCRTHRVLSEFTDIRTGCGMSI